MIHSKNTKNSLLFLVLLSSFIAFSYPGKAIFNIGKNGLSIERTKSEKPIILPCNGKEVIVHNAVSANDDGFNDFFYIEGIENCPNNTVSIYNRWGALVYETQAYGTKGNVFKGLSEGRGVVNNNSKLVGGTYFYIINFLDESSREVEKKAGYLYLND